MGACSCSCDGLERFCSRMPFALISLSELRHAGGEARPEILLLATAAESDPTRAATGSAAPMLVRRAEVALRRPATHSPVSKCMQPLGLRRHGPEQ